MSRPARLPARLRLALQHSLAPVILAAVSGAVLLALGMVGWPVALAAVALTGGCVLAVNYWLVGLTLGPIAEITRVARQIAATGRLEDRVPLPPAHDELQELVNTLNAMLARLERNVLRQRRFLADASHELRGPLMVIRGNLDLLQMDLPADERKAGAREAAEEADRMARLVGDLLFLAEEDAHERLQSEPVHLEDIVAEVWQRACSLDVDVHEMVLACNEPVVVLGDHYRLTQMLWNLVENALRYTNEGGRVTLCSRLSGEQVELTIADTGIGIPAEHIPHLFERFYRVDRARLRVETSTGLGLPIVKQVAEAHGGEVRVTSQLGAGSTFTVLLPRLRETPTAVSR